nr:hypothetical protein [Tanacetum cinerariifolium]
VGLRLRRASGVAALGAGRGPRNKVLVAVGKQLVGLGRVELGRKLAIGAGRHVLLAPVGARDGNGFAAQRGGRVGFAVEGLHRAIERVRNHGARLLLKRVQVVGAFATFAVRRKHAHARP